MELNKIKQTISFQLIDDQGANHQAVCQSIIDTLSTHVSQSKSTGIYLATSNAGMQPSILFWKLALEQGVGFMSPQNFPWTLANAPSANIALGLKLHGPNYTFIGDESALIAAKEQAIWDLEDELIESYIVISLNFSSSGVKGIEVKCYLGNEQECHIPLIDETL